LIPAVWLSGGRKARRSPPNHTRPLINASKKTRFSGFAMRAAGHSLFGPQYRSVLETALISARALPPLPIRLMERPLRSIRD
jgi:hypothetical protein